MATGAEAEGSGPWLKLLCLPAICALQLPAHTYADTGEMFRQLELLQALWIAGIIIFVVKCHS